MKNKAGILCMILGVILLMMSLLLMLWNFREDEKAGEDAQNHLQQIQSAISRQELPDAAERAVSQENESEMIGETESEPSGEVQQMTVVSVDGYDYIGYLSIPDLALELPVIGSWSDSGAKIAPCRHLGSVSTDDLVIAGHNFNQHFGRLKELQIGDLIAFTDMNGTVYAYTVAEKRTIDPTNLEVVTESQWPLILYTCTYGGQQRVLIGCEKYE